MIAFPSWMSSNPIVDVDISHKSHQMIDEVAKEHKIPLADVPPYNWFTDTVSTVFSANLFNIENRIGRTGYPDFLTHDEIAKSVMWGNTRSGCVFVVIKFDVDGKMVMNTFYERRPKEWISCGIDHNLMITEGGMNDTQFEFIANVITGRSIVLEDKHSGLPEFKGKTIKLFNPHNDPVSALVPESVPALAEELEELEFLPDGRRIPKIDEIITFRAGDDVPDDECVGRSISTYSYAPITPTDSKHWRVVHVDPHGNCINVKGSRVDNSNAEPHDVPQVYIHVEPVNFADHKEKLVSNLDTKCFWWIDFTNKYIRQWEDSTIIHSVHDLEIVEK